MGLRKDVINLVTEIGKVISIGSKGKDIDLSKKENKHHVLRKSALTSKPSDSIIILKNGSSMKKFEKLTKAASDVALKDKKLSKIEYSNGEGVFTYERFDAPDSVIPKKDLKKLAKKYFRKIVGPL